MKQRSLAGDYTRIFGGVLKGVLASQYYEVDRKQGLSMEPQNKKKTSSEVMRPPSQIDAGYKLILLGDKLQKNFRKSNIYHSNFIS